VKRDTGAAALGIRSAILVLLLVSPFSLLFLAGGSLPTRTLLALPFVMAAITGLAISLSTGWLRLSLAVLAAIVVLHNASLINRLAASSEISLAFDRVVATAMLFDIERHLAEAPEGRQITVAVVGGLERELGGSALTHDIFGSSFFGFNGGQSRRVVAFLKTLGLHGVNPAGLADLRRVIALQEGMQTWPHPEGIRLEEDLLVIKLGPFTQRQILQACREDRSLPFCK
jgi:hypothetical protein